jgi:hypothetical protein
VDSPDDSLGVTLSLSHNSHRGEVSWSSSDGSTYYSGDELSLKQRKQTHPVSDVEREDKAVSVSARSYELSEDRHNISMNVYTRNEPFRSPVKAPKSKKSLLNNVESFPAIDIATGNEDVSAVGFLTTEDTAEVFCTSSIPLEITANKKLYEKLSPVSSSSTVDISCPSTDLESDEESRKHQSKHVKWAPSGTERARRESQTPDYSIAETNETSIPTAGEHSVVDVSVSYQDPVSSCSLENASTDDASGDGSCTSNEPRRRRTRKSSAHTRDRVTSQQIESKVGRIKQIKRKKSDLRTDERIRQLKAKIKSIQDLSSTNVTVSSSEVESNFSTPLPRVADEKEDTIELPSRRHGPRDSPQRNKSIPTKGVDRHSSKGSEQYGNKSLVGTMIPVGEREDVSVLNYDVSARGIRDVESREVDIETGQFRTLKEREKRISATSISDETKALLFRVQTKVIAAYDYMLPIIERKKIQFQRKPKYEQILIISIAAMSSLFLILLFIMISPK